MRRSTIVLLLVTAVSIHGAEGAPAGNAELLWDSLQRGNREYAAGDSAALRKELRDHQSPPVTVLGCSDSRVPPELIFGQPLGSLFVIRTAGNTADDFGIASIEYAVAHGYTRLIVVLGHAECGAVRASLAPSDATTRSLGALLTRIRSSFAGVAYDPADPVNVRRAVEANARAAGAHLIAASSVLREAVQSKRVRIITAYYDLESGVVRLIE